MIIDSNELQPENADHHILVTEEGIVTVSNELQYSKACPPMPVTEEGIDIDFNELQPEKALSPMLVTEEGIVTLLLVPKYANSFRFFWSINISPSTTNKGLSIVFISRNNLQSEKTPSPMLVTEEGMVMDSSELQYQKALFPILVTEEESTMDSNEPQS